MRCFYRFEKSMPSMFRLRRGFNNFMLHLLDFLEQLIEIFNAKLFEDMIALREIIVADKVSAWEIA